MTIRNSIQRKTRPNRRSTQEYNCRGVVRIIDKWLQQSMELYAPPRYLTQIVKQTDVRIATSKFANMKWMPRNGGGTSRNRSTANIELGRNGRAPRTNKRRPDDGVTVKNRPGLDYACQRYILGYTIGCGTGARAKFAGWHGRGGGGRGGRRTFVQQEERCIEMVPADIATQWQDHARHNRYEREPLPIPEARGPDRHTCNDVRAGAGRIACHIVKRAESQMKCDLDDRRANLDDTMLLGFGARRQRRRQHNKQRQNQDRRQTTHLQLCSQTRTHMPKTTDWKCGRHNTTPQATQAPPTLTPA